VYDLMCTIISLHEGSWVWAWKDIRARRCCKTNFRLGGRRWAFSHHLFLRGGFSFRTEKRLLWEYGKSHSFRHFLVMENVECRIYEIVTNVVFFSFVWLC